MKYLFVDTTYDLSLGLLDENLNWIDFATFDDTKKASQMQIFLYELLKKNSLRIDEIKKCLYVNGPGFYTGLRIGRGFSETLRVMGQIESIPFYSYEIPRMLGEIAYCWITKAYRGETFIHSYENGQDHFELIRDKDFNQRMEQMTLKKWIHCASSMSKVEHSIDFALTSDALQKNPKKIIAQILSQTPREKPFYFRALEDEFKVSL